MVNGKPTLTLGDNQYAPSKIQQRAGSLRTRNSGTAGGFESYLPVADYASQAKTQQRNTMPMAPQAARPVGFQADAGQRQPFSPAMSAGGTKAPAPMPNSRFPQSSLAGYPEIGLSGAANLPAQTKGYQSPLRPAQPLQNSLPTGGNNRVDARTYAQSTMESFGGNRDLGSPAMRLSQKNMPRISGRPITGRYDFGMVDTRKMPTDRTGMAPRGDFGYGSPAASPMQAQAIGANSGYGGYARNSGGTPTGQSFVTHGFGGGNAELALRSLGYDIREQQPATTYAQRLDSDTGVTVGANGTVLRNGRQARFIDDDEARTAVMTASHRKKDDERIASAYPGRSLVHSFYSMADSGLGSLAAKFESGSDGISAIGFDRKGGTSYGKYQIASRTGTMNSFIDYLDEKAPDIAKRLRSAGPANTGGRSGRMPDEWRNIASADPARFEKLQEDFIRTSHFEPAMRSIAESTGIGFTNMPVALQEVLFSTAVQHGPFGAVRIFNQALNNVGVNKLQPMGKASSESVKVAGRQLIKQVYALRAGQFMSSSSGVRAAVRNRLSQEMNEALEMLA